MSVGLAGRAALVTGSTAGLGYAIAEALAAQGCPLALHGLESEGSMTERCAELESAYGVPVHYVAADLASAAGVEQLVTAVRERLGTVGVLVNNAVTRHFAPIEAFPPEAWDRSLAVNVSAAFHAVRLVMPGMRGAGWGRIVNMVSVYGQRGTADRIDYVTSKAALIGLTRGIAVEAASAGITCNAVCPGSVSTPGTEVRVAALEAEGLPRAEAVRRFLAGKQPTGRFVEASSVVAAVLFLCGPAGRDVTGTVLPVDGSWLASRLVGGCGSGSAAAVSSAPRSGPARRVVLLPSSVIIMPIMCRPILCRQ